MQPADGSTVTRWATHGAPKPKWSRRLLTLGLTAGASAITTTVLAAYLIRHQAAVARRLIGKPLGEEALLADRTYKKKYGDPLHLLLLGDSIAAGLGPMPPGTRSEPSSRRDSHAEPERAVRLRTAAIVGSETSMLRTQLGGLPAGYRADVAVIVVGGNDVTHRVRTSVSQRNLAEAITAMRERGTAVVVGTCPDLGALTAVPQPLRALARVAARQLAAAQRDTAIELGAHAVSLADVVGPFFVSQPDEMFAVDRFHPSGAGYRRTAKALLPSVMAALGVEETVPHGHHAPVRSSVRTRP